MITISHVYICISISYLGFDFFVIYTLTYHWPNSLVFIELFTNILLKILECKNKKYGRNCNRPCGNCLNKAQCHPFYGYCMDGCATGFAFPRCKGTHPIVLLHCIHIYFNIESIYIAEKENQTVGGIWMSNILTANDFK